MSPRSNCSRTKLASKCVGRSKRLTQPKLNLENQFQTPSRFSSLTLSLSLTHTIHPHRGQLALWVWFQFLFQFQNARPFISVALWSFLPWSLLLLLVSQFYPYCCWWALGIPWPRWARARPPQWKSAVITLFRQAVNKFNTKSMLWK